MLKEPTSVVNHMTVDLAVSAEEAWDYMWDPSSVAVAGEDFELGVTLPGTPPGEVGEIQVFVHRPQGGPRRVGVVEVVELTPGRVAITRDPTATHESLQRLVIEPLGERSCRLTQSYTHILPVDYIADLMPGLAAGQVEMLEQLRVRLLAHFGPAPA